MEKENDNSFALVMVVVAVIGLAVLTFFLISRDVTPEVIVPPTVEVETEQEKYNRDALQWCIDNPGKCKG